MLTRELTGKLVEHAPQWPHSREPWLCNLSSEGSPDKQQQHIGVASANRWTRESLVPRVPCYNIQEVQLLMSTMRPRE